jgi:cell division protein FtsZ
MADVIFGQGIDPDLKKGIRVTVIATGFETDSLTDKNFGKGQKKEEDNSKKLIHLESGKTSKIEEDEGKNPGQTITFTVQAPKNNAEPEGFSGVNKNEAPAPVSNEVEKVTDDKRQVNEDDDFEYVTPEPKSEPKKVLTLFDKPENQPTGHKEQEKQNTYQNDYFEQIKEKAMKRAHERFEKLRQMRSVNQTPEEFKEKLEVPAYQRKKVQLHEVQHSSERSLSKFNLNDDNEIISNNRFLHDNVD